MENKWYGIDDPYGEERDDDLVIEPQHIDKKNNEILEIPYYQHVQEQMERNIDYYQYIQDAMDRNVEYANTEVYPGILSCELGMILIALSTIIGALIYSLI